MRDFDPSLLGFADKELANRAHTSILVHLPMAVVFYGLTGYGSPWLIPFALATIYRWWNVKTFPGASSPESQRAPWRRDFALGVYACAALWSVLASVLVWTEGQSHVTTLVFLLMSGILSGGVTSLAPDYGITRNFVLVVYLLPFLVGLCSGTWSVVLILAIYQFFLLSLGKLQHDWFWQALSDNFQVGQANQALRRAERAKSDFFASVSHDLRTPLTLIVAPLDTLESSLSDSHQQELVRTVKRSGQHLLAMVNDLLDFAKLEAKAIDVRRASLDVADLCRSVCEVFTPAAVSNQQSLALNIQPDCQARMIDGYLMERILYNLLGNAIKFTPAGGRISLSLKSEGDFLVLTVSDNGIGIEKGDLVRIFRQFEQVEVSTGNPPGVDRRYQGTGLGLAMVQQFCQLLGGSISVQSTLGEGSVFEARLLAPPASDRPQNAPLARLDLPVKTLLPGPSTAARCKDRDAPLVLLAEDNPELAHYISELLSECARVELACDGAEALGMARQLRPRLIISDLMMPRMNGLELCRELKSDHSTSSIPFIILTASAWRETMLEAWEAGADEFLMKPFHPLELLTRTRCFLQAQGERERAESQRRMLERRLREAERRDSLQRMGGGIAHSFNNLLAVVQGSLELAKLDSGNSGEVQELLDTACNALSEANRITRSVTLYLNCFPVILREVDLATLSQEVVEDFAVPIQTELRPAPLEGDADLLQNLIENLLTNALEASHGADPAIVLSTGLETFPEVFCGEDFGAGNYCFLKVRDQGCGMDDATRRRLLDPFFTTKFPGRGLGMSAAAGVIQSHHAHLHIQSSPQQGTTIWVLFPAREAGP